MCSLRTKIRYNCGKSPEKVIRSKMAQKIEVKMAPRTKTRYKGLKIAKIYKHRKEAEKSVFLANFRQK